MSSKKFRFSAGVAPLVGLLASTAMVSGAWAHTISIGYENAGPGSVNFWYGTYNHGAAFNQGSLQLVGPGTNSTVPFNLLVGVKPGGLIDGTTNFYTPNAGPFGPPGALIGTNPTGRTVTDWQGATFSSLAPGTYTFTYIPIANPSALWAPWDTNILSNTVTLTGLIVGAPPATGEGDTGIAAVEGGLALTTAQAESLRQIVHSNNVARQEAVEGASSMTMSANGPSNAGFSIWAETGGGFVSADFGENLDVSYFTGQAGIEAALFGNFGAGIGIGGAQTSAQTATDDLDGDALFIQPYVTYSDGPFQAVVSFIYTYTDYDDTTDLIDSGNRFVGTLSLGYDIAMLQDQTVVTPFGFLAAGVENYDTNAGNADASFAIARLGVELSRSFVLLNTGTMKVFASGAAEYVSTSEPDFPAPALLSSYNDDRLGGRVEVGLDFTISGTDTQLFVAANGSGLGTDAPGMGGRIGLTFPF